MAKKNLTYGLISGLLQGVSNYAAEKNRQKRQREDDERVFERQKAYYDYAHGKQKEEAEAEATAAAEARKQQEGILGKLQSGEEKSVSDLLPVGGNMFFPKIEERQLTPSEKLLYESRLNTGNRQVFKDYTERNTPKYGYDTTSPNVYLEDKVTNQRTLTEETNPFYKKPEPKKQFLRDEKTYSGGKEYSREVEGFVDENGKEYGVTKGGWSSKDLSTTRTKNKDFKFFELSEAEKAQIKRIETDRMNLESAIKIAEQHGSAKVWTGKGYVDKSYEKLLNDRKAQRNQNIEMLKASIKNLKPYDETFNKHKYKIKATDKDGKEYLKETMPGYWTNDKKKIADAQEELTLRVIDEYNKGNLDADLTLYNHLIQEQFPFGEGNVSLGKMIQNSMIEGDDAGQ